MRALLALIAAAWLGLAPSPALAQDGGEPNGNGRRSTNGQTTTLAFDNVSVERVIPFIVESTGKVVIPRQQILNRKITILSDQPIPQMRAVDLVFLALQQEGIAVIETDDIIFLGEIAEIAEQELPVIPPNQTTLDRTDRGTIAQKVYTLTYADAASVAEIFEDDDALPDYALLSVDESSNNIVVRGSIALLQQVERVITAIDNPRPNTREIRTFQLRYADAEQVAENIRELYESDQDAALRGARSRLGSSWAAVQLMRNRNREGGGEEEEGAATDEQIRVTANAQQNTVTVFSERAVLEDVGRLIQEVWDQPVSEEAVVTQIYDLKYSDPVKIAEILVGLFGESGGRGRNAGTGRLAGQFSFQPIPEANRLIVVSQTPDGIKVIDNVIDGLDQPQTVGLPAVVELKHADAEELAEQLNALLATEGTLAQIPRQEQGLSDASDSSASPFATQSQNNNNNNNNNQQQNNAETITFWWQRARPPVDSRGASNLVGQLRIVPVWRQNAVMVLAPPEYRQSLIDLIDELDQPGRQVLISAVIAEISLEDVESLGLRVSNDPIDTNFSDNILGGQLNFDGLEQGILGDLFTTSTLAADIDVFAVLQLLGQNTSVNILSEPKIFTSDNQEATFFDGQDIPFIIDSQFTDTGTLNQSTEYRAVGIQLRVRPRITLQQDVDLRVNLELSSIAPGLTINDQFIVDRRETTTQLVVSNGQTVVISGILRAEDSDVQRKVPFFGDLPLVGFLFRSTEKEVERTELVAFVTPYVVDNPEDLRELNEPYNERLREMRRTIGRRSEELMDRVRDENSARPAGILSADEDVPAEDEIVPDAEPEP